MDTFASSFSSSTSTRKKKGYPSTKLQQSHYSDNDDNVAYESDYGDDDYGDDDDDDYAIKHNFKVGDKILIEVVNFGPLGASVHVVAGSHNPEDLPPENEEWPVLAIGLISQQELSYFRDQRQGMEVVLGEVLPAHVERIRQQDQKLTVGLRAFGGKQKAMDIGQQILRLLKEEDDGTGSLQLGDKSSPAAIATVFPGVSKSSFKKAVSALYKQGIIDKPQPQQITLNDKWKTKKKMK